MDTEQQTEQHSDIVQPSAILETALDSEQGKIEYLTTIRHTVYILGALGALALVGVLGVGSFRTLSESAILMGSNVVTGAIAALGGVLVGQAVAGSRDGAQ